jgi:hypothetical protein
MYDLSVPYIQGNMAAVANEIARLGLFQAADSRAHPSLGSGGMRQGNAKVLID